MHLLKHSVNGNGGVHVAVDLACAQAEAGHDVVLASAGGPYDDLLAAHGVRVEFLPRAEGAADTLRGGRLLLAAAQRFRPDVLHAHMMSSAVLGFGVSKIVRAPMVTTVHNSFDRHSVLMRLGRRVVAVSDAERELLISKGFRPAKVVTVLNGPDGSPREAMAGEDLGPLHTPAVMTLSGLHPRKAVGDVITAFARVLPEFPDWHLNIVGWGPQRDELMAQVDAEELGGSVHFLGSTLTPRPLLEQAEIFATGTLADPCPLTVGEARGAGCAIVATAVGGIPELLEGGRAGLLVPPQDPAAMAAAFRELMDDDAVRKDWRDRSLDGAEYFTVARASADYLRVYESVVRR
ncbi:glycosyltransferase family 4 protein [Pseudonocardia alni]|uniref:glycosyltransferase family 4 protein n=1 Tax=Pseudonocardia alni TaxID=33907 RepID=UPI0038675B95